MHIGVLKPLSLMLEGHEIAQKSKFLQKNVITVKELLNILHGKSWNKY